MSRRNENGSVMLEYALLIPFLLFMTFSIIQLSLLYVADSVMEYAAFSAARAHLVEGINSHPEDTWISAEPHQKAAEMICSLISFGEDPVADRIDIPGWGKLYGSAYSKFPTTIAKIEDSLVNNSFTATVDFEYTMLFPQLAVPFLFSDNLQAGTKEGTIMLTKSYTMNRSF